MAYELFELGHLSRVDEVTFATDPLAGYIYVPVVKGSLDLSGIKQHQIPDETMRQDVYALPHILGKTGRVTGDFKFESYLYGWSATVPTAAPAAHNALTGLIGSALGGFKAHGYLAAGAPGGTAAGCLASPPTIVCTDSSSFRAGQLVTTDIGAAPTVTYASRFMYSVNDQTDTMLAQAQTDYASAAEINKSIWGSAIGYWLRYFDTAAPSQTFVFEGDAEKLTLVGCRCREVSLSFKAGELPKATFTWAPVGYTLSTSPAMAVQTHTPPDPVPFVGGRIAYVVSATLYSLDTDSLDISVSNDLQPQVDPNATYGIAGWRKGGGAMVKATIKPYYNDAYPAMWTALSSAYIEAQCGTIPGQIVAVRMPVGEIEDYTRRQERDSNESVTFIHAMGRYTGDAEVDAAGVPVTLTDSAPGDKYFAVCFG